MFKKILIPYDLSKPSQDAFRWAAHLSEKEKAKVELVHVLAQDRFLSAMGLLPTRQEVLDQIQQEIKSQVYNLLSEHEKDWLKDKLQVQLELGEPVERLIEEIKQSKPDLVVMGTHGWTGLKHIFLGSKAEKIVRESSAPVLVSRKKPTWPVKKVLIPVDFNEYTEQSLMLATQFMGQGVEFEIFHAVSAPDITFYAPHLLEETRMEIMQEIENNIKKELAEIKAGHPSLNLHTHYSVGPSADEIAHRALEINADLIIIPTHARSGLSHALLGSVAESVVRYAPCSVLSFHPED